MGEFALYEERAGLCSGVDVFDPSDFAFHRVISFFNGRLQCEECKRWAVFPGVPRAAEFLEPVEYNCPGCGKQQSVMLHRSPGFSSIYPELPENVHPSQVVVVPVKLAGDEFNVFTSVNVELDGYDLTPLSLPPEQCQTVRNSFSFVAFESSVEQRDRLKLLARVLGRSERGFWAWSAAQQRRLWIMLAVSEVCGDMVGQAGSCGLLEPQNAGVPTRVVVVQRSVMVDPRHILAGPPRTREHDEVVRQAASMAATERERKELLQQNGLSQHHSPLLSLCSLYDIARQHKHCYLHVWNLGCFQFFICTVASFFLKPACWAAVVKTLQDKNMCPGLGNRLQTIHVAEKKSSSAGGNNNGGKTFRVGGRKANGGDVDALLPNLLYVIAFHIAGGQDGPESALSDHFVESVAQMESEDRRFWEELVEPAGDRMQDGSDFYGASNAKKAWFVLCTLLGRFCDAYELSKSWHSSQTWEEEHVTPACFLFMDAIRHCAPFWEAFRNKPKAAAIAELALQRQRSGSAVPFSQIMRETGHKAQRQDVRLRSDRKNPTLWVLASLHTRYLLRVLLEGGNFQVFSDDCYKPDNELRPLAAGSAQLSRLLRGAFMRTGLVSRTIAVPDTPLQRVRSNRRRGHGRAVERAGLLARALENAGMQRRNLDDNNRVEEAQERVELEENDNGEDDIEPLMQDWIWSRTNPSRLLGGTEKLSKAKRNTFGQGFVPPATQHVLLSRVHPFLVAIAAAPGDQQEAEVFQMLNASAQNMRTAEFKRLKLKPVNSFRHGKWVAQQGSALQLRMQQQRQGYFLYVVQRIFGCIMWNLPEGALPVQYVADADERGRVSFAMVLCLEYSMVPEDEQREGRYSEMPCDFFAPTGREVLVDPKLCTGVRRTFHACNERCQARADGVIEHGEQQGERIVAQRLYIPREN